MSKNKVNFAPVKKIMSIIIALFALFTSAMAQGVPTPTMANGQRMDSVEISLLTCTAGPEIWEEYGHTALRVNGLNGQDMVFSYGVFDQSKPYFIWRFIFGLTDYMCAAMPFSSFDAEFREKGMGVTEQVLRLTVEEKMAIVRALVINVQPENRVYRYNFFYDNCATRPRDIILGNLSNTSAEERLKNKGNDTATITFRSLIHDRNTQSPWNRYGEDLLLGIGADQPITAEKAEFLPDVLMNHFQSLGIARSKHVIIDAAQRDMTPTPITPYRLSVLLFVICLICSILERRRGCHFWLLDGLLLLAAGCVGVILTLMLFSQHPTVRVNLLLLIFNPLPLIMFFVTIYNMVRAREHSLRRCWATWCVLILLGAIGGFFQQYPEGMSFLALSLLLRCSSNLLKVKHNA